MEEKSCEIPQYNLNAADLESFLGPLEARVLQAVWSFDSYPITVRDCYKVMNEKGKIAYTTVMSTMDRLHEKGYLERSIERGKGGLLYKYWPKMSKDEFNSHAVREIIGSLVNKFGRGMVASCFTEEAAKRS
jgi:predicted transcriptional regulator